jgi:hypothetical protein
VAVGDKHTFGTYSWYETLYGPMVAGVCVDCGARAMEVGRTDRYNQWGLKEDTGGGVATRCNNCARKAHGLPALSYVNSSTLMDEVHENSCRYAAGFLYCINHNCSNPHHRSPM